MAIPCSPAEGIFKAVLIATATNAATQRCIEIPLQLEVVPLFTASPDKIVEQASAETVSFEQRILVHNNSRRRLEVDSVKVQSRFMTASAEPVADSSFYVHLKIRNDSSLYGMASKVEIHVSLDGEKSVIPLAVTVLPP